MSTLEDTDPGYTSARLSQLRETAKDHELRIRDLEKLAWRVAGAATVGAAMGSSLVLLLVNLTKGG